MASNVAITPVTRRAHPGLERRETWGTQYPAPSNNAWRRLRLKPVRHPFSEQFNAGLRPGTFTDWRRRRHDRAADSPNAIVDGDSVFLDVIVTVQVEAFAHAFNVALGKERENVPLKACRCCHVASHPAYMRHHIMSAKRKLSDEGIVDTFVYPGGVVGLLRSDQDDSDIIFIGDAEVGQRAERLGHRGVGFEKDGLRLSKARIGLQRSLAGGCLEVWKVEGVAVEIGAAVEEDGIVGKSPCEECSPGIGVEERL